MEKLFVCVFVIILACSASVVFADELIADSILWIDDDVRTEAASVIVTDADYDREKIPGTTPRPDGEASLFQNVDEEAVAVSYEIYYDFSALDPQMFMYTDEGIENYNSWGTMTHDEHEYVKQKAKDITRFCNTANEKIRTVAEYVAVNVCYDKDYETHGTKEYEDVYHSAYDVLINGSAVCNGYAITCMALLESLDIPCVFVLSPNHAWNMAYNGDRWILFDATWMSYGELEYGILNKSDKIYESWYDFSIEFANNNFNHTITQLDYTVVGNTFLKFPKYSVSTKSWKIPEEVTVIADYAFYGCKYIENIELPDSLESIGRAAFYECESLEEITIPDNVTVLGEYAFQGCTSLKKVNFGNGISEIPYQAFCLCESLEEIIIPDNVILLGEKAFLKCTSVKNFVIGNGLTSFDNLYFYSNVENVVIGDGITEIPNQTFFECSSLKNVVIGKNVKSIGEAAFYACESLKEIEIPDSVMSLDVLVFQECSSLQKVEIGNGITKIPQQAFYNCSSLEEVVIGTGVRSVSSYAFDGTSINKVYYKGTSKEWANISFSGYNKKLTGASRVYVANTQMEISNDTVNVVCRNIPSKGCDLYVCCYSGGRLVKTKILKDVLSVNDAFALEKGTDTVKVFMFGADRNLIPVAEEEYAQIA